MKNFIYIGNALINLERFAGFEFDEEKCRIWAYLPYLDAGATDLSYTTFTIETRGEFEGIKNHIESFVTEIEVVPIEEPVVSPIPLVKPKLPLSKPPTPVAMRPASTQVTQPPVPKPKLAAKAPLKTPFKRPFKKS